MLRTNRPFWKSRPAGVMLLASLANVLFVASLTLSGVLMSPLSPGILGMLVLATAGFALVMDFLKRLVFSRSDIDRRSI